MGERERERGKERTRGKDGRKGKKTCAKEESEGIRRERNEMKRRKSRNMEIGRVIS